MIIESGETIKYYWLKGPMSLIIEKGSVEINGAFFQSGEHIVIHSSRSYTAKVFPGTKLTATLGNESVFTEASPEEAIVYEEWTKKADTLTESCSGNQCTILLLGDVDSGKTSFATMISNTYVRKGRIPYLIDADPGQNTIGLPGFLSSVKFKLKSIWPKDVGWDKLYFLGKLSPAGVEKEVIAGILKLAKSAHNSLIVIDTDGWVFGPAGEAYKYKIVNSLMPDYTVIIGDIGEKLKRLVVGESEVISLRPPPRRAMRSREERRLLKSDKMIKLLEKGNARSFGLCDTPIIAEGKIINYSICLGKNAKRIQERSDELKVSIEESISSISNGKICALMGPDGWVKGAGVVIGIKGSDELLVKTDYGGEVKAIQIGYIRLNDDLTLVEDQQRGEKIGNRAKAGRRLYAD